MLEISEANQRVLLHRGRSRLRQASGNGVGGRVSMFWSKRGLVCQEMVELITDYLEDALPRAQTPAFRRAHRRYEHCTEYLEQMRVTIRLTGQLRAEDLTPAMRGI